jgi:hypothetical protein
VTDFKRLHVLPRRWYRYEVQGDLFTKLTEESVRQKYIRDQSEARYKLRPDAYTESVMTGEVGVLYGMQIITDRYQHEQHYCSTGA